MSTKRLLIWGLPGLLFLVFTSWYTDLGGPLSQEEIARYLSKIDTQDVSKEQRERIKAFMESDTGRQFFMLNAIDFAENPPDVPGANPGEDAQQLMDRYMEHMYAELFRRACHPTAMGNAISAAMDLVGVEALRTAGVWDVGALMRYRSRRTFMEIVTIPETSNRHAYKVAALNKTIAYPIEMQIHLGDPRSLLGLAMLALAAILDLTFIRRKPATN